VTEVRLARLELRVEQLEARLSALEAGPRPPVAREQLALEAVR
jgi:BMFP domain-containing protein YqiC